MILDDHKIPTIDRLRAEARAMDGTDCDAADLTTAQWAKVKAHAGADYGSPVEVHGRGDFKGMVDRGYLTRLPDTQDDWDMVGMVHLTYIDLDEGGGSAWHSLYSLCRMEWVKEIRIGTKPSGVSDPGAGRS